MEESLLSQIDEARLEALITDLTRDAQVRLNTNIPGIVTEWDATEQLATVKAVFKIRINEEIEELEPLVKVPVRFLRGGNFCLTFPVKPGDEVQLKSQQRSIVKWLTKGDVQDPADFRLHDISDVIASLDMYCQPRKIDDVSIEACELRTLDGKMVVQVKDDQINLKSDLANILVEDGNIKAETEQGTVEITDSEITATVGDIDMALDSGGTVNFTNSTAELLASLAEAITAIENLITTNGGTINPVSKAPITAARIKIETFV